MAYWGHNAVRHGVILNRGDSRVPIWRALGIRVSQHYAVLWLGAQPGR